MLAILKTIWRTWKKGVHGINAAISWTLMSFVYWTAVMPVALFMKMTGRQLLDRSLGEPTAKTFWCPPRSPPQDIRRSQRPW